MSKNNFKDDVFKLYKSKGVLPKLKKGYKYGLDQDGGIRIYTKDNVFSITLYNNLNRASRKETAYDYDISKYSKFICMGKKEIVIETKNIEYEFIYE